jgi:hypothetical protein
MLSFVIYARTNHNSNLNSQYCVYHSLKYKPINTIAMYFNSCYIVLNNLLHISIGLKQADYSNKGYSKLLKNFKYNLNKLAHLNSSKQKN